MSIKLTKTRSGNCRIEIWQNRVSITSKGNSGEITVHPRYKKQIYDIIKLIKNGEASLYGYHGVDYSNRKYYKLSSLYKANYTNKIVRFYSNNILEEDFDDIIELLKGIEIDNKVSLNQKDLCDYNLLQLKTILTSMKRRKKVNGEKDNYFINLEV